MNLSMDDKFIGQSGQNAPKLLDHVRAKVCILHYSYKTEAAYVH